MIVVAAVTVEAVAARYPGVPFGLGLVASALLGLWHWSAQRRGPALVGATLDRDGRWWLAFGDGSTAPATLLSGSRVLGSSVVLRWGSTGRGARSVWLTPRDVPSERLRELTVRLLASGARSGV